MFFLAFFKVWFQNRRTKWRKKHAAEMATSKRRADNPNSNTHSYDQLHTPDSNDNSGASFQPSGSITQANDLQM